MFILIIIFIVMPTIIVSVEQEAIIVFSSSGNNNNNYQHHNGRFSKRLLLKFDFENKHHHDLAELKRQIAEEMNKRQVQQVKKRAFYEWEANELVGGPDIPAIMRKIFGIKFRY